MSHKANHYCPQLVFQFYQEPLTWISDRKDHGMSLENQDGNDFKFI